MQLSKTLSDKARLMLGTATLLAAPTMVGCAGQTVSQPYPSMQMPLPSSPTEMMQQTGAAAEGAILCLQNPPDITVSTANAVQSCLMGSDLPAEANCGGYQFQAICHSPSFGGGVACLGVNSVTCDGVTVLGQLGPIRAASGRVPVRVTMPVSNSGNTSFPASLPQFGGITWPQLANIK